MPILKPEITFYNAEIGTVKTLWRFSEGRMPAYTNTFLDNAPSRRKKLYHLNGTGPVYVYGWTN